MNRVYSTIHHFAYMLWNHSQIQKTHYCKNPKKLYNRKIAVIILKFEQCGFYHKEMSLKDAERMANSVDPNQTVFRDCSSRCSLIWVYTVCPDLSVQKHHFKGTLPYSNFRTIRAGVYKTLCPQQLAPNSKQPSCLVC